MTYRFTSALGIEIARTETPLDYADGIGFLVETMDRERGCFFSSGVEDPDRCLRHGRHRAHPHRGLCRCSPLRCTPLQCSPRARRGLKASRGIYRGPTLMRRPGQPRELPLIRALRSTQ